MWCGEEKQEAGQNDMYREVCICVDYGNNVRRSMRSE